ncbi:hypothetical protein [Kitasatospora sp. NPDC093102]|uniref:hypothetical protein n=1 Tax=Kitasatospora sp. NPDC093102 TaxID=3155069 RepID=UPI003432D743
MWSEVYALRYEYADSGYGLSEGFETPLAPRRVRKRFAAEGIDRGRGRINRAGLGEPDRIVAVRGAMSHQRREPLVRRRREASD